MKNKKAGGNICLLNIYIIQVLHCCEQFINSDTKKKKFIIHSVITQVFFIKFFINFIKVLSSKMKKKPCLLTHGIQKKKIYNDDYSI